MGADVNVRDTYTGQTVLVKAVVNRNRRVITYLLRMGASAVVRDHAGKTALDYFDELGVGSLVMRGHLIRAMNADANAGSSAMKPFIVE